MTQHLHSYGGGVDMDNISFSLSALQNLPYQFSFIRPTESPLHFKNSTLIRSNIYPNNLFDYLTQVPEIWNTHISFSFIRPTESHSHLRGIIVRFVDDFDMTQHLPGQCFRFSHEGGVDVENISFSLIRPTESPLHFIGYKFRAVMWNTIISFSFVRLKESYSQFSGFKVSLNQIFQGDHFRKKIIHLNYVKLLEICQTIQQLLPFHFKLI